MTKRNLFKKLGNRLLKEGRIFLIKAFGVKRQKTTRQYIENLILAKTGIPKSKVWQADGTYYYTDLKTIKDILEYDLTDERKYLSEEFDCDDFAETINARFRRIYGINTVAVARYIEIVDAETDKHINWHRANVFVAMMDGKLEVFYLEPQTDYILDLTSKEIVVGSKKYILNTIDF